MKLLTEKIQKIAEQYGGSWGIVLEDLDRGDKWEWQADEIFYAASIIKVPIMVAAYDALEKKEISFSDTVRLNREELVGGSGVLQHLSPGMTSLTIYDLVVLMIVQSDNTATNMLIDLLGVDKIKKVMTDHGWTNSKCYNKLMTIPVEREGSNIINANEMSMMLKQMVTGKLVSAHACEEMITIMKKQQIRDSLPGKLPSPEADIIGGQPTWELANKTGNITKVRHDIGIFYVEKRTFIATILSRGIDDYQSIIALQNMGLEIFNYLKKWQ
ncbi:class A beta-lactamase-related serine hydrolase [Virgibacillus sp. MSJ-26]|uniref:serine hydrolase n=1 Tax=Virgibacillus sp. MSJ-26 TaxID=2841522 RepID=UPI001C116C62|nr:serine hydrolase [Virgibacillus sp. MSJ-26]MBU5465278.1 class A beta-lactamase-related serine hydrolase [Virgibacillus sp. MSJ-26]